MKICSYEWRGEGRAGSSARFGRSGSGSLFRNGRRCQMQTVKKREGGEQGSLTSFCSSK